MKKIKYFILILTLFLSHHVSANWVTFYQSEEFDAKLLLKSVHQDKQKTKALIVLNFKNKSFSDNVGSYVLFLEHICGEVKPVILEEKFYQGIENKSKELSLKDTSRKLKKYIEIAFPKLIKQICI
ncbi:hypothetical protein OAJ43_03235 [Nitrosomonadales bacterium]|nr:hypothetical protein [Nitrosomonadales bacterium]